MPSCSSPALSKAGGLSLILTDQCDGDAMINCAINVPSISSPALSKAGGLSLILTDHCDGGAMINRAMCPPFPPML